MNKNNNKYNDKSKKLGQSKNNNIINDPHIDSMVDDVNFQVSNEKCISPCYPPNYLYYHPHYLFPIKNKFKSCSTEQGYIQCDKIDPNYKEYNVFKTIEYVGNDPYLFILELYDINNVRKSVKFLEHEFDKYPILTCKRILTAIFNKFNKNNDFPLHLFSSKFENIFKEYYKPNKKIDYFEDIKSIIFSNPDITDIFIFFHEKFL